MKLIAMLIFEKGNGPFSLLRDASIEGVTSPYVDSTNPLALPYSILHHNMVKHAD